MAIKNYPAFLEPNGNGGFGVFFPDFPGCVSAGDSLDQALAMAAEALALHIEGMQEDGETIPDPGSFDHLPAWVAEMEDLDRCIRAVVPCDLEPEQVRVNVSFERGFLDRLDRAAQAAHMTRSGFLVEAARQAMRRVKVAP